MTVSERKTSYLRSVLDSVPPYRPGRKVVGPDGRSAKLSSNESPFGPLPSVRRAVADAAADLNRYPDPAAAELTAALARRFEVPAEHVALGAGSVGILQQLLEAVAEPGAEVVYAWRSFEAYPILVQVAGGTSVQVPNTADGRHDLDAMAAAIGERTRMVIVCTPNNPTGATISHSELVAFLEKVPSDVMVLLDEAYVHFVRSEDPIDAFSLLPVYKNLVILRTFAKAYGLAGLRVGYAVGRRRLIRTLRTASTPFGVNAIAQAAALAAIEQDAAVGARVAAVVAERERVLGELRAQGWDDIGDPQGNFFWLPLGDAAGTFAADALAAGVTVRPFAGDGVRVTIGEPEANDIVLELTKRWVRGASSGNGADETGVGGSLQR